MVVLGEGEVPVIVVIVGRQQGVSMLSCNSQSPQAPQQALPPLKRVRVPQWEASSCLNESRV